MLPKRTKLRPGMKLGRLTIVAEDPERSHGWIRWICRCECGNTPSIISTSLRNGDARSCGCGVRDATIARSTKHGMAIRGRRSPEHQTWHNMRTRCQNPASKDYPYYGGRGITICPEWSDFATFYQDMGPRPSPQHSIDRIDNDGPYAPENCRWTTRLEQGRNKRNNIRLTHNGQTMTLAAWALHLGLPYERLRQRLKRGRSIADVLSPSELRRTHS